MAKKKLGYTEAVRIAIDVCNTPKVKREIMYPTVIMENDTRVIKKEIWDEDVEKMAILLIKKRKLGNKMQNFITSLVLSIGRRMITWAKFHERALVYPRSFSYHFINPSFFTNGGLIDCPKAAEALMAEMRLTIEQRYKLACMYCFTEDIMILHSQMTAEMKQQFYRYRNPKDIRQLEMVTFWSTYIAGEINSLKENQSLYRYRLKKSIESSNQRAVEICLKSADLNRKKVDVWFVAIKTVRCLILADLYHGDNSLFSLKKRAYSETKKVQKGGALYTPSDYYVDILYAVLLKMSSDQRKEFLKKDIEGCYYSRHLAKPGISRVLQYFLHWPYQTCFMELVDVMWDFLPEDNFADMLLRMCEKIELEKGDTHYGEERGYDYRIVINEFWSKSPERFKRHIFAEESDNGGAMKAKRLLVTLYLLKNITPLDRQNIKLILTSATEDEREDILLSDDGINICSELIRMANFHVLDEFIQNVYPTKKQVDDFRGFFSTSPEGILLFIGFLKEGKIFTAETFLKWAKLKEHDELKLKSDIIGSKHGMIACTDLVISETGTEIADGMCRWCFTTEEQIANFKHRLIFSKSGVGICAVLITEDKFACVDHFVEWCLSVEDNILQFKRALACRKGGFILMDLIGNAVLNVSDSGTSNNEYSSVKWEQIEKFLTWCFSSEDEIVKFKKSKWLFEALVELHFHLLENNKWMEAGTLFEWLELSPAAVKQLKKFTLFNYSHGFGFFSKLVLGEEDGSFLGFTKKQEAIDLFLGWFLADEEIANELKDILRALCQREKCEDNFEAINLVVENYIADMKKEM